MNNSYLVHVNVISDKPLTEEQLEELFCYLESQTENGANVRAEVAHSEQIY